MPLPAERRADFFRIVNAGFRQKRKQVANSLSAELGLAKRDIHEVLVASGIDPRRRAETITIEEWARLTETAANRRLI